MLVVRGVEKVLEADIVEGRRGLEAGDMAAELGGVLVGAQDDRQRVPTDERPDAVVESQLPHVQPVFLIWRDGVHVRRGGAVRDQRALPAGLRDNFVEQEECAVGALERHDRIKRIHPLAGLGRVKVFEHVDPHRQRQARATAKPAALSSSHQRQQSV